MLYRHANLATLSGIVSEIKVGDAQAMLMDRLLMVIAHPDPKTVMKINMSGIGQITSAITQLGSVIQQNAGSSEELASMAEELFAQSQSLRETIGFFKLDETALLPKQTEETDQLELPP